MSQILAIDITDDQLHAVLLERQSSKWLLCAKGTLPYSGLTLYREDEADRTGDLEDGLSQALKQLLEEQIFALCSWKNGQVICGLSLAFCSVRLLDLPFHDERKIRQILPFELASQLPWPREEPLVADYILGQHVLTFALQGQRLSMILAAFLRCELDPDLVVPAILPLAEQVAFFPLQDDSLASTRLLLYLDTFAVTMAFVEENQVLLVRRIAWRIAEATDSAQQVALLWDSVEQTLALAGNDGSIQGSVSPERIFLAGPYLGEEEENVLFCKEALASLTALPIQIVSGQDFFQLARIQVENEKAEEGEEEKRGQASPDFFYRYTRALCLALEVQGDAGKRKKKSAWNTLQSVTRTSKKQVNFRRDSFRKKKPFLHSRLQVVAMFFVLILGLAAGLGSLWYTVLTLEQEQKDILRQQSAIFRSAFPGVQPGPDPYMHMLSRLQNSGEDTLSLPLFNTEQRVLRLLADISARIPKRIPLRVNRLLIDQKNVHMRGTTSSFNEVDAIKNILTKSTLYTGVKIVSATAAKKETRSGKKEENSSPKDSGEEAIRFEIRLTLQEEQV